ncbi:pyruvate, water dikinase regulatory protein [Candidatus Viridilinea mediisalina]|uniref:Transcriptional regulator n=1 Tax=Candidatus Viridilinea mediisalina TaxID=2024553 RepID=A0A2A6RGD6_9CHLR|nr:pyruvate, water dikinase regulatory protein [Candidatus Viridilinea mediisalina]PDW01949.1 transcriptional regulator [Candidatus Viridilinea mediisalina]
MSDHETTDTSAAPGHPAPPLYIVSGGEGVVGSDVARLVLSQFDDVRVPVIVVPNVRTPEQVSEVVAQAEAAHGTILHTLMESTVRRDLVRKARACHVAEIDLVGTVLARVATVVGKEPIGVPGRYRQRRSAYFDRFEAIEYSMQHDDGARTNELEDAEIVLVGISRVGKTPLSMYLAVLGWKVANIPLVKEIPPPEALFKLDRRRVIGLIVEAEQITARRRHRQRRTAMAFGSRYFNQETTEDEVEWARRLFRRHGWATVNLTDKSIEESADEIIALITRWFKHG